MSLWRHIVFLLLAAVLPPSARSGAQTLPAASSGGHLWVLHADPEAASEARVVVLHRGPGDVEDRLTRVRVLRGDPTAVAAAGASLWMVFAEDGRSVVSCIVAGRDEVAGVWTYRTAAQRSLPTGSPRALAAAEDGVWAMVRAESSEALAQLTREASGEYRAPRSGSRPEGRLAVALGLPPRAGPTAPPTEQPAATQGAGPGGEADAPRVDPSVPRPPAAPAVVPADRLLILEPGGWRLRPLPEDWPHGRPARMVLPLPGADAPVLLVKSPDNDGALWVYRFESGAWSRREVEPADAGSGFEAIAVDGQVILVRRRRLPDSVEFDLSVLRSAAPLPIGTVTFAGAGAGRWAAVASEPSVAILIERPADGGGSGSLPPLWWARMDLRGRLPVPPGPLLVKTISLRDQIGSELVLLPVLALSILLMIMFWRRDPDSNQVTLPPSLVPGDVVRRAIAGLVDLLPGAAAVMLLEEIGPLELQARWPGLARELSWEALQPGLIVIGVFLAHTTVSELLFARTIGKALTRLRVATLTGDRPRAWQVLLRGVLKALDLVALPLLILPLIAPSRQRLGDMVARTVVVADAPPDADDPEGGS